MSKPKPTTLRDAEFIISEFRRFQAMTFAESAANHAEHPDDFFYNIPASRGGHYTIGKDAGIRLEHIAGRIIASDGPGSGLGLRELLDALKAEFVGAFDGKAPDQRNVAKWINAAKGRARKSVSPRIHYLACVLVSADNPEELRIGGVRFRPVKLFLDESSAQIESDFRAVRSARPPSTPIRGTEAFDGAALEVQATIDHFRGYRWLAEVYVPPCNYDVSRDRAERATAAALNVLRLIFGPYGGRCRLAVDPAPSTKVARLTRIPNSAFRFGYVSSGEGVLVEDGWFEALSENTHTWLRLAGSAVDGYLDPTVVRPLRDRWLDALDWYGQAMTETRPAAALMKFVTALETLTTTGVEGTEDVTDRVSRRSGLLIGQTLEDQKNAIRETREIYKQRSKLTHGRVSPLDSGTWPVLRVAHRIVPWALEGALVHFWNLANQGRETRRDLERLYIVLEQDFIDAGGG